MQSLSGESAHAGLAAAVPLPFVGEAPCDIYQTQLYGGGCIHLYYSWISVFFVAMCASTLFEGREQVGFQIFMTVLRAGQSSAQRAARRLA